MSWREAKRDDGLCESDFHPCAPSRRAPVWTVPDRLFGSQGEAPSPRGRFGWRVHPLVLFIIAKMNLESMQALPESHFCTFEPQRHHRNAFSGLSHFPQLLVVLGLPYSLGVLCTQNHFTMRSPFLARRGLRALLPGRDFPARTEVCYPDSAVRLARFVRPKSPGQLR